MGKGKLAKFAELASYGNVFEYPYAVLEQKPFNMKGLWNEAFFKNTNPVVVELGCGKGEYAVALAKMHPERNYVGVDIKGARLWTGATQAINEHIGNVAFLRTNIEFIDRFFGQNEVEEIWLTFSDPQMKSPRKRLTSTFFLERYRRFLTPGGIIHLKTDSNFLFTYTRLLLEKNQLPTDVVTDNLYTQAQSGNPMLAQAASIQTYYERMWLERGLNIKYIRFRLPAEGTLVEPEVEIETDDYRSYHRNRRSPAEVRK